MLLLTFLLVMTMGMTAAAENDQKVVDMADILTTQEEEKLQNMLQEIAEKYQCDAAVVTTETCEGKSAQDYTDDYYDANDYGYGSTDDGIILMVCMGERQFHLATRGTAITMFTDYGLEVIDNQITEYLTDGDYYKAFKTYGDLVDEFIEEYETTGKAFDVRHAYKEKMEIGLRVLISAAVGLVLAVIVVVSLFAQLRTVAVEKRAHEYVRSGSFRVTRERDLYLYRTVSRRRKEKSSGGGGGGSSTHKTSGGSRAGGRTGSF